MTPLTTANLIDALRQYRLLGLGQIQKVEGFRGKFPDPRLLAKQLHQLGWITSFQVNQLLRGCGAELVLGPYVLLDRLGEGGTGQVFKARHQNMQRDVALKILRRELLTDAEVVGRFHREIEVVSQISHPNIVHAYDAGPIGANLVLAMEFIDGRDLDRLVRDEGPLPVAEAVEFIRQAATGLQHAHERGLVHRDIKPANLLVSGGVVSGEWSKNTTHHSPLTTHQIKILDLGLARLTQAPQGSRTANLTLLAGEYVTQGTPDYMAPEQALDFHQADIRSDIYSLGCTLFFLLTGQAPFPAGTLTQKLMKHQQAEPPAVQKKRPEVPDALAKVLGKMMAKRAADRFQTPGAVAEALTQVLAGSTIPDRSLSTLRMQARLPPGKTARSSRLSGIVPAALRWTWRFAKGRPRRALGAVGLLLVGLALVLVPFDSSEQAALKKVMELLNYPDTSEAQVLHRLGKFVRNYPGMLEPLREELLYVGIGRPGTPQAVQAGVWLTYLPSPLDQLGPQQIPEKKRFAGQPAELVAVLGDSGASYRRTSALAFRPDCKTLAVAVDNAEIGVWDFGTGTPQRLPNLRGHRSSVVSLAFTPNGKWLASGGGDNHATGDNHIRLWDFTAVEIKAEATLTGHTSSVNALAVSADGKWLASSGEDRSVRLWDVAQREGRVAAAQATFVRSLAFAPDGKTLAVAGTYWPHIRFLDLTLPATGKFFDLKIAPEPHCLKVAYTPDGKALAAQATGHIVFWDPSQQAERGRLKGGANDFVIVPDGKTLIAGDGSEENQANVNVPDGRVLAYAIHSPEPYATWRLPCGGVKRLALASDGRHVAVGGRNCVVYILRLAPPKIAP